MCPTSATQLQIETKMPPKAVEYPALGVHEGRDMRIHLPSETGPEQDQAPGFRKTWTVLVPTLVPHEELWVIWISACKTSQKTSKPNNNTNTNKSMFLARNNMF